MQRRTLLGLIGAGVVGTGALAPSALAQDSTVVTTEPIDTTKQLTMWRDPNCGCCDTYGDYLEANGYQVKRIDDRNFDKASVSVGVPEQGLGCHLAKIEKYFVSGLIPVNILERLVAEQPDIIGITLPGMPRNAPGMAREKYGTLKTYAFGANGISVYSDE